MGVVLRYIIFSEYAQVSVAVYMWYSLAGCVVGLLCYWILINLYYRVSSITIFGPDDKLSWNSRDKIKFHENPKLLAELLRKSHAYL